MSKKICVFSPSGVLRLHVLKPAESLRCRDMHFAKRLAVNPVSPQKENWNLLGPSLSTANVSRPSSRRGACPPLHVSPLRTRGVLCAPPANVGAKHDRSAATPHVVMFLRCFVMRRTRYLGPRSQGLDGKGASGHSKTCVRPALEENVALALASAQSLKHCTSAREFE